VVFKEPLEAARLNGFALIWMGLAIYAIDALWRARSRVATA
jgi:EamA domain-containing membrane protein RarD